MSSAEALRHSPGIHVKRLPDIEAFGRHFYVLRWSEDQQSLSGL